MKVKPFTINGEVVYMEVVDIEAPQDEGQQQAAENLTTMGDAAEEELDDMRELAGDIKAKLAAVVGSVQSGLRDSAPDEWSVELGLTLEAKYGLIVASGKTNASVKVKATWKKGSQPTRKFRRAYGD